MTSHLRTPTLLLCLIFFLCTFPRQGTSSEFARGRFDNSAPGGVAILEIMPSPGEEPRPGHYECIPLKKTDITGTITGPLGKMRVVHTYSFSAPEHKDSLEALYRFPLPGDAAVLECTVTFGDVSIRTELKEREEAEKEYEKARKEGHQGVLLTRETPNVFTLAVQGIRPDEEVTVATTYVQMATPISGGWSLRIPLTTAPRYVRQDEKGTPQSQGNPFKVFRDPGHTFSVNLEFHEPCSITSPTHDILRPKGEGNLQYLTLARGAEIPDRDLVVQWFPTPSSKENPVSFRVYEYFPPGSHRGWFFGLLTPRKSELEAQETLSQEIILLVDHSGSMKGPKWEAADWGVVSFLNRLGPENRFALGFFHDTTTWFAPKALPATRENITKAVNFLKKNRDNGGTNLGVALEQGLSIPQPKGNYARHLLVVTDAQVTDNGRILRLVDKERAKPQGRSVSILCIDAAPNDYLAQEIARKGGGIARFLTSAPEETDITTAIEEVLDEWSAPLFTEATLEVTSPEGEALQIQTPWGDGKATEKGLFMGDLPWKRPRWIVGCFEKKTMSDSEGHFGEYLLKGRGKETPVTFKGVLQEIAPGDGTPLKALYGALRLNQLEQLYHGNYPQKILQERLQALGYDKEAQEVGEATVYQENTAQRREHLLKPLLVRESLFYGIPCEATAFTGIRRDTKVGATSQVFVGNALPAGWDSLLGSPQNMQFRKGASGNLKSFMVADTFAMDGSSPLPMESALPKEEDRRSSWEIFRGIPRGSEAEVLWNKALEEDTLFSGLTVALPKDYQGNGVLLIYLGDLAEPRVRVSLKELALQGGKRPLHIKGSRGQVLKVVLQGENHHWEAPLGVTLVL